MALSTQALHDVNDERHLSASASIRKSAVLVSSRKRVDPPSPPSTTRQRSACQRRLADTFLYMDSTKSPEPLPVIIPADSPAPGAPLISIGPKTDTVLDRFSLGDDMLPWLHSLVSTVCSSRWEAVLRGTPWNLTYEQASNLSNALLFDLKGTPRLPSTMVFHPLYLCRSLPSSNSYCRN